MSRNYTKKILENTYLDKRVNATVANYSLINNLSKSYNFEYYFILQPTAYTWEHFRNSEISYLYQRIFSDSVFKNREIFQNHYYKLIEEKLRFDPFFLDLTNTFDNETRTVFVDHIHYNDLGAEILARNITKSILPILDKKRKKDF